LEERGKTRVAPSMRSSEPLRLIGPSLKEKEILMTGSGRGEGEKSQGGLYAPSEREKKRGNHLSGRERAE